MSIIEINLLSRHLEQNTTVSVIIPGYNNLLDRSKTLSEVYRPDIKYKTLYLLHGAGSDHTDWKRFSSIERYAQKKQLAVVMPSGYNSCYTNTEYGLEYFSFLSEELPLAMQAIFPLSDKREDRYVAGFSMGGRGAFLWALRRPDFFSAAACLSGSLDIDGMIKRMAAKNDYHGMRRFKSVFGELEHAGKLENNVYLLAKNLVKSGAQIPKLFCACGTEDIRFSEQYETFVKFSEEIGLPLDTYTAPGDHDFDFWDPAIERVIEWLPTHPQP